MRSIYLIVGVLLAHFAQDMFSWVVIPDNRLTANALTATGVAATSSTFTEASPIPDVPAAATTNAVDPGGMPSATLAATGTTTSRANISVVTHRAGAPDGTAQVVISDDGGTTYQGANSNAVIRQVETVRDSAGSSNGYRNPFIAPLGDGRVIVAAEDWVGTQGVWVSVRSAGYDGTWGSPVAVWDVPVGGTAFSTTRHPSPCLDVILYPSGSRRINLWSLENHLQPSTSAWLRLDFSDDDGATWTVRRKLLEFTQGSVDQLRVVRDPISGVTTLVAIDTDAATDIIIHYISYTDGMSWSRATSIPTATMQAMTQLHMYRTGSGVLNLVTVGTHNGGINTNAVRFRKAPTSPQWDNGFSFIDIMLPAPVKLSGHAAWWDGCRHWFAFRSDDTDERMWLIRNFNYQDFSLAAINETGATGSVSYTTGLTVMGACFDGTYTWHTGELEGVSTTYERSVMARMHGGLDFVGVATSGGIITYQGVVDLPADAGWTRTTAATASQTVDTSFSSDLNLSISTTAGTNYYSFTIPSTYNGRALVVRAKIQEVTGSPVLTADDVALRIDVTDGTDTASFSIRMSTTQMRGYDNGAAAYAAAAVNVTYPAEIVAVVDPATFRASAWVRSAGSDARTEIFENELLTDSAGTTSTISWGHRATTTAGSVWNVVVLGQAAGDDGDLASGLDQSDPREIEGIDCYPLPTAVADDGTLKIMMRGTPATGDTWSITGTSATPFAHVVPATRVFSPQVGWTSGAVSASSTSYAVWDLGSSASDVFGRHAGISVLRSNLESIALQYYDGATWQTVQTLSLAETLESSSWTRSGRMITLGSSSAGRLIGQEAVGAVVELRNNGGTLFAATVRAVEPGQRGTGALPLQLYLDDTPLSGTYAGIGSSSSGGSTRVRIFWPSGVSLGPIGAPARYWRVAMLTSPYHTTQSIGSLYVGRALPLPLLESPGWSLTEIAGDTQRISRGGMLSTTRERPPQRIWTHPHRERVVGSQLYDLAPTEVSATTGASTASALMLGTMEYLRDLLLGPGGRDPFVWVPDFKASASTDLTSTAIQMVGGSRAERFAPVVSSGELSITGSRGQRYGTGAGNVLDSDGITLTEVT